MSLSLVHFFLHIVPTRHEIVSLYAFVQLRIFRTETESVVGLPRHTLCVLYFCSKVGKFRYNFYFNHTTYNTENYERDKYTYLSDIFPSFMGSVMWIINTLHVLDLYSILSYTVLGELNENKQAVREERPISLNAAVIFLPRKVYGTRRKKDDVPAEERRHICCMTSLLSELTLHISLVTVCTTCCNNQKLCILSIHCICVPPIILTINKHYFLIQHSVICLSNGHCVLCEV